MSTQHKRTQSKAQESLYRCKQVAPPRLEVTVVATNVNEAVRQAWLRFGGYQDSWTATKLDQA